MFERADAEAGDHAATSPSTRPAIPYLPGLEGLRGVAVLGVLFFHAGFTWAKGGFLGVSTFFTLSGFLITLLLVWEFSSDGRVSLRRFWARRYRRLMPASLTCLAGVVVFGATVATASQLATLRGDILSALAYVANWHFIVTGQSYANLFSQPSPVLHFWSLAIEEQFYLVFPVLVAVTLAVSKGSRRVLGALLVVLAGLSLLSMFLLFTPGDPSRVYYGTTTRAFELLVGALLALVLSHPAGFVLRIPRWAWATAGGIAALVTLGLWASTTEVQPWLYQGGLAGYTLMSALVIVAAIRRGPIRSALSLRPIMWLGSISYGVYLYHWPIFLWLTPVRTHLSIWPLFALRMAVTLPVAIVSARFIENPIRRRERPVRFRPAVLSVAAVTVIIIGTVVVTAGPHDDAISFAAPVGPALPDLSSLPSTTLGDTTSTVGASSTQQLPPPIPLTPGETPRVLLLGDSAALTLGDGLVKWGTRTGDAQVWDAGKLGCSVGRGGALRYLGEPRATYDYCDWTSTVPPQIKDLRPQVIAVLYGTWDVVDRQIPGDDQWRTLGDPVYDDFLRSELSSYMDMLTAQGSTVVWMLHPYIEAGIADDKNGPENDPRRMDAFNQMIKDVAATKQRIQVLDLPAHMRSTPEGELSLTDRPDGIHWTRAGSAKLAPWLGETLVDVAKGTPPPPVSASG